MTVEIQGIPVNYKQYGEGKPILFIHGWSVDHRLMSGCFEPVFKQLQGYCRIYLDLPGMGMTPSASWIKSGDDTHKILLEFINTIIGDNTFLLAGESYGGYLSMGLLHTLSSRIDGVFFLCPHLKPLAEPGDNEKLPEKSIIYRSERLEDNADVKGFLDMAVIATNTLFEIYKKDIISGVNIHDKEFLSGKYRGEYNPDFENNLRELFFDKPSCFLTGRQDHCVGYSTAFAMLKNFPRATFAVLDCAGHNLQIESEAIFAQLVKDWIWRVELEDKKLKLHTLSDSP